MVRWFLEAAFSNSCATGFLIGVTLFLVVGMSRSGKSREPVLWVRRCPKVHIAFQFGLLAEP